MGRRDRLVFNTKPKLGKLRKHNSISQSVKHWRHQTFYAERGLVHVINELDGEYKVVSIREFVYRIKALRDEIPRTRWGDERVDMQSMVEAMIIVAKRAQHQGDPLRMPDKEELAQARKRSEELLKNKDREDERDGGSNLILPGQSQYSGRELILP